MISYELLTIINKYDIELDYCKISKTSLGYQYNDLEYACILIDPSVIDNDCLHNVILAEEIGHYFTTMGDNAPRYHNDYTDRLRVDKTENDAIRWATNFLIEPKKLYAFIIDHYPTNIAAIAKHFQVTDSFITKTFEIMALQNPNPKIDESLTLCLDSLPSIYILELI